MIPGLMASHTYGDNIERDEQRVAKFLALILQLKEIVIALF